LGGRGRSEDGLLLFVAWSLLASSGQGLIRRGDTHTMGWRFGVGWRVVCVIGVREDKMGAHITHVDQLQRIGNLMLITYPRKYHRHHHKQHHNLHRFTASPERQQTSHRPHRRSDPDPTALTAVLRLPGFGLPAPASGAQSGAPLWPLAQSSATSRAERCAGLHPFFPLPSAVAALSVIPIPSPPFQPKSLLLPALSQPNFQG
jgi:hypothetical protein